MPSRDVIQSTNTRISVADFDQRKPFKDQSLLHIQLNGTKCIEGFYTFGIPGTSDLSIRNLCMQDMQHLEQSQELSINLSCVPESYQISKNFDLVNLFSRNKSCTMAEEKNFYCGISLGSLVMCSVYYTFYSWQRLLRI